MFKEKLKKAFNWFLVNILPAILCIAGYDQIKTDQPQPIDTPYKFSVPAEKVWRAHVMQQLEDDKVKNFVFDIRLPNRPSEFYVLTEAQKQGADGRIILASISEMNE